MELILTEEQKQYLDKKGLIKAASLKNAYKKSVQQQNSIKKRAEKIRRSKK